jgi:hypothetical protein
MSGPANNALATAAHLKPTHPAIKAYHAALAIFAEHGAEHEGATETAFSRLLTDTAKLRGWILIPKKQLKVGGKTIYPDGTLQDENFLRRGTGKQRIRTTTWKRRSARSAQRDTL